MERKRILKSQADLKSEVYFSETSFRNLLDTLPFRLRLDVIDFFPIFVEYSFDKRWNSGKLNEIRFSFDMINYEKSFLPCYPPDVMSDLIIYKFKVSYNAEENKRDESSVFKSLTKRIFGYFRRDRFRKLFPIWKNVFTIGNIKDIKNNLYRYLPKITFTSLYVVDPVFKNGHRLESNQLIRISSLRLEINYRSLEMPDSERVKNYNQILDHIPKNFLKKLQIFQSSELKNIFDHLHFANFRSITKLTLVSTTEASFHRSLNFFPNLRRIGMGIYIHSEEAKDEDKFSGKYDSLRYLSVSGSLLSDRFLLDAANLFPNLFFLNVMSRSVVSGSLGLTLEGIHKFFHYVSKRLRQLDFTCSFDSHDIILPEDPLQVIRTTKLDLKKPHLESVVLNTEQSITVNELKFIHQLSPNLISLTLFVAQESRGIGEFIKSNFSELKCLKLQRKEMRSLFYFRQEEHLYKTLASFPTIEELHVDITNIYNLMIFLYWKNLRVLNVTYFTTINQGEESLGDTSRRIDTFTDVGLETLRIDDIRKYETLIETFTTFLKNIKVHGKLPRLGSFSFYVGHQRSHNETDYITRFLMKKGQRIVERFRRMFIHPDDPNRAQDGVSLEEFEFGSNGNDFDPRAPIVNVSKSPIFIWRKGLGVMF